MLITKNVNNKQCAPKLTFFNEKKNHFLTPPHYTNSQNSIISFGYVDSQAKIFLILYPQIENSTTLITILCKPPLGMTCKTEKMSNSKIKQPNKQVLKNQTQNHTFKTSFSELLVQKLQLSLIFNKIIKHIYIWSFDRENDAFSQI